MRTTIPPEIHTEVIARYVAGDRPKNIANALGINDWNVSVIVRRAGVSRQASEAQKLILSRGEWIGNRQYSVRDDAFSTVTPDSAYWCGFLMADGCVIGNKVKLKLAIRDIAHIEKFRAFMETNAPIFTTGPSKSQIVGRTINSNGSASTTIASEQVVFDLARFGVIPRKSMIAKSLHMEMNRDFWRGVIDGNGWIVSNKSGAYLGLCGSHPLMEQFLAFCKSVVNTNIRIRPAGNIFKLYMSKNVAVAIMRALYEVADTSLDRKAEKVMRILNPSHG